MAKRTREPGRFVTLRSGRVIFIPKGYKSKWADVRERVLAREGGRGAKLPGGWAISPATKDAVGPLGFHAKAKQLEGGQWEARGHAPDAKWHESTELPNTTARAKTRGGALAGSVKLLLHQHKRLIDEARGIAAEHDAWVAAAPNAKARREREMSAAHRFVW